VGSPANHRARVKNEHAFASRSGYAFWDYHSSSQPQEVWIEFVGGWIKQLWKGEPEGPQPPISPIRGGQIIMLSHQEIIPIMRTKKRYAGYSAKQIKDQGLYTKLRADEIMGTLKRPLIAKIKTLKEVRE
jgi:hypothetical protein